MKRVPKVLLVLTVVALAAVAAAYASTGSPQRAASVNRAALTRIAPR